MFVLLKEHKPVIAHRTIPKPCQQKAIKSCTAHKKGILSNGHVHKRSNNLLESKAKPGGMIDKEPQLYPVEQIHRPPDLATKAVIPFLEHTRQMKCVISAQWNLLITIEW